jgi:hypothetical protein
MAGRISPTKGVIVLNDINEIITRFMLDGKEFIPDEWKLNLDTLFYEHKHKKREVIEYVGSANESRKTVPHRLSLEFVHSLSKE